MELITRKQAKAAGLKRYFTGKPCKYGHIAERQVSNFCCAECRGGYRQNNREALAEKKRDYYHNNKGAVNERASKYRKNNKGAIAARDRNFRQNNKGAIAAQKRDYRQNNKEAEAERARDYREKHPEKRRANGARRRAAKIDRLPAWYSDEDREHEELLHKARKVALQLFGEVWHVDHIYPLQGKTVSGLHCADNLQLLSEHDNLSKHNKHPDDWTR